ncbi:MAG: hypothetical protein GC191_19685 [Azospirillum sp.]|nr:hypothetical protein [Azospirillum sp.]
MTLAQTRVPPDIELTIDVTRGVHMVAITPSEITLIVMNLVLNAVQAIESNSDSASGEHPRREIRVVGRVVLVDQPKVGRLVLWPGAYLELAVSDTGAGIPEEIVDRVFDPFFTTKAPGDGTGLGLFMVHSIITNVGGSVAVTGRLGGGAVLTAYLPIVPDEAARDQGVTG